MIKVISNNKVLEPIPLPIIGSTVIVKSLSHITETFSKEKMKIFEDIDKIERSKGKLRGGVDMYKIDKIKEFARLLNIKLTTSMRKDDIIDSILEEYRKYLLSKKESEINKIETQITYGVKTNDYEELEF